MAKRGKSKQTGKSRGGSRHGARRRQFLAIVLGGFAAFLFVSLVTWAPEGSSRGDLCGATGRILAEPFLAWFGFGAFALFGLVAYWGGAALAGARLLHPVLRGGGIVLVTLCSGAFCALVLDDRTYMQGGLYGPGGLAGAGLAHQLRVVSGSVGAFLVAITGTLTGLALATDWLLVEVARDVGVLLRRAGRFVGDSLPHLARAAREQARRLPRPVPALSRTSRCTKLWASCW